MEKFRIVLTPSDSEGLLTIMDITARNVDAAREQATAYLAMLGNQCKSATVMSQWKSPLSWRQALDPIIFNNNL